MVDALCGLEKLPIRGQMLVVIGGAHLFLFRAVLRTETGARVRGQATALTAIGVVMATAARE